MAEHVEKQHKPVTSILQTTRQLEDLLPQVGIDATSSQPTASNPPPLKPNSILQLQSIIGNQAVQRLFSSSKDTIQRQDHSHVPERIGPPPPPPPTEPYGYTGPVQVVEPIAGHHMPPEEADAAVRSALGPYLIEAIREGRQITDHVYIVDDAMWDRAGLARYGHTEWVGNGERDRIAAWTERDNSRVFIHRDREDIGVMIHEALHLYSSNIGFGSGGLREGIVEYFTLEILRNLTPPLVAPNHYPEQSRIAEMLIRLVGRDVVARANFEGDVDGLITAYQRAMFLTDPDDWDHFIQSINDENWAAARQFVTPFAY